MSLILDAKKAYIEACLLELSALKPGNVGYHSEGHGMTAEHFEVSAEVSSNALFDMGINTIGERISEAVKVTHQAIADNTNLGIILLTFAAATLDPLPLLMYDTPAFARTQPGSHNMLSQMRSFTKAFIWSSRYPA